MATVSCIICTYNEAERIERILDAVCEHPELTEVIVVNDGSTDDTLKRLERFTKLKIVTYAKNRGKTYAMSRGIAAAHGELLLFLDADLSGLTRDDVSSLLAPVLSRKVDVSLSLRRNSLSVYRLIGLDFVSGERVLYREFLIPAVEHMEQLPRWGAEVYINQRIIRSKLRVAVVYWPKVYNIRKYAKVGVWKGLYEETRMTWDAFHVLPLPETLWQNVALLKLKRHAIPSAFKSPRQLLPSIASRINNR